MRAIILNGTHILTGRSADADTFVCCSLSDWRHGPFFLTRHNPPRVTLPDTPAGRLFGMSIQAFNSGDSAKMGAFVRQYMPELQTRSPATVFTRLRRRSGGIQRSHRSPRVSHGAST